LYFLALKAFAPASVRGKFFIHKKNIVMIEVFIELTDQIFWQGYTAQMAESDPQRFQAELNEFLTLYKF
jgi:hypothetical protein